MGSAADRDLLKAAQEGDKAALERLLQSHQAQIYRFAMKLCGHPEDARDVLQDTMLAMARSIRDFRGGSALSTWLYTIARNNCGKKRRRSKYAPSREESLENGALSEVREIHSDLPQPDEASARGEVAAALERAIAALDPEQREVLVLRDVEGLKATEVAQVLELSVPAVKSRLHRARRRLRDALAPDFGQAPVAAPAGNGCPDVLDMYSKKLEGEVSADLCAQMEAHLQSCPHCRQRCDSLKRSLALCQTAPTPAVPPEVQESVRAALRRFLAL